MSSSAAPFSGRHAGTVGAGHLIRREGTIGVTVHRSIRQAETAWRRLERTGIATAFQRHDWLRAWQRHIGARRDVEPRVACVAEDGRPVLLLPLGLHHENGLRILRFLGGSHANYNLGLYDRDFMIAANRAVMRRVMGETIAAAGEVDMVELRNQPESWMGLRNPLSLLPHQSAPSAAYSTRLCGDFEALMAARRGARGRKKLRWQERMLERAGGYAVRRVETMEEGRRVLDAFARQKASRFKAQGIHNVFGEPGVMDFLDDLVAQALHDGEAPAIELYYLTVGGKIRATFAGAEAGHRFSGFFNSIASDELTRTSPGELLLTRVLEAVCRRRLVEFDLGIGEARYKSAWCDHTDRLFDTLRGMTLAGKTAVAMKRTKLAAKRQIKQNGKLWAVARQMRQALFGEGADRPETADKTRAAS